MMSSSPSSGGRSRFPFTVSQWQELEHQALIFKYMVSGMPVPPDLLFTIKRSLDSTLSSSIFPQHHQHHQHQNMGWSYLQMGLGRKVDPEPGRCRRTDGKKWRCSREAFSDSKYCERHMHRGKNRSRKHVENITSPSPPPPSTPSPPTTTPTTNLSTPPQGRARGSGLPNQIHPSPSLINETPNHQKLYKGHHPYYVNSNHTNLHNHSLFPHPSSLRSPGIGIDLSLQESTTQMLLDSGSSAQTDYYRYVHGLKEQSVDERCFFSTGDSRAIKCFSDSRQRNSAVLQQSGGEREYSNYLQLQSLGSSASQQQMQQSTYLLGRNIGSNTQMSQEIDREEDKKQSNIHNFFDEWPPSSRDSWPGSRDKSPVSMTKLSISIPSFNSTTTHNI